MSSNASRTNPPRLSPRGSLFLLLVAGVALYPFLSRKVPELVSDLTRDPPVLLVVGVGRTLSFPFDVGEIDVGDKGLVTVARLGHQDQVRDLQLLPRYPGETSVTVKERFGPKRETFRLRIVASDGAEGDEALARLIASDPRTRELELEPGGERVVPLPPETGPIWQTDPGLVRFERTELSGGQPALRIRARREGVTDLTVHGARHPVAPGDYLARLLVRVRAPK